MPWTPTGYVPQTKDEIIDDINAIFEDVFGTTVNTNPSSPNGQAINNFANLQINNQNYVVMLTSNLYNPEVAQGVWLNSICSWNGIIRQEATYSTATCECTGSSGTLIPAGTQVSNPTTGDIFTNEADATIGITGVVDVVFTAQVSGAIPVLAGTITNIINKISGWDTVNNSADGVEGSVIQSDASLRDDRTNLLATYGSADIGSIAANLKQLTGVEQVYAAENNTSDPLLYKGVLLDPNSIFMAIIGGQDEDIAQVLYNKKCPGVNQNGNTSAIYIDTTIDNYEFTAKFQRPIETPLQINIELQDSDTLPSDAEIKAAIVNNFNGDDPNYPTEPVQIAQIINVSRFTPSLLAIGAGDIISATIELVTGGTPAPQIQLDIDKIGTLIADDVIVTTTP